MFGSLGMFIVFWVLGHGLQGVLCHWVGVCWSSRLATARMCVCVCVCVCVCGGGGGDVCACQSNLKAFLQLLFREFIWGNTKLGNVM